MLPRELVLRTCSPDDVASGLATGELVEVEWGGSAAVALSDVAESEELLADGLAALAEENRLAVVVGADADARAATLAAALGPVPAVVLDEAHRVGLDEVLAAVEDLPEESVLALCLDPALPLAAVPGAVALDLAASGVCPVLAAPAPPGGTALDKARVDVAAGAWFGTTDSDRSVVEVRVSGPEEALRRVEQLVGTSIPRAFSVAPSDVAVLLAPGSLEPAAVRSVFGSDAAPQVVPLAGPLDRDWDAAVVVLGPVGPALTRAVVYAGLRAGRRHVTVVHGAEPAALAAAVAAAPDRPRRTRLAALLTS